MLACLDHLLACAWSAVTPSCGDTDEMHLSLPATGTNENVARSYPLELLLSYLLLSPFIVIPYIWWDRFLCDLNSMFLTVCEKTKDQTKASSFGPIWNLAVEPLWYRSAFDRQVPVFTYISWLYFCTSEWLMYGFVGVTAGVYGQRMRVTAWWRCQ